MNSEEIKLFVPGRICLFGEHSDWAGAYRTMNAGITPGHAIVTGTEQGIYGIAKKSDMFSVISNIPEFHGDSFSCEPEPGKLRSVAKSGGFFSYVAGVASYICEWYHVGGIELNIVKMDLPMKSGLSSSAAICVMVAKAYNELYDLRLNTNGLMHIAYMGEQRTPSRCGRLDQACAFGKNVVKMTFDGNEVDAEQFAAGANFYYVIADLKASKDTIKILADLNKGYPFSHNEKEDMEHVALGEDNEKIVSEAERLIRLGDAEGLGKLMIRAQANFDEKIAPMCETELTAPVLHSVLNDEKVKSLSYGAKGIGSQGDGTVQILARDKDSQDALISYLITERKMDAYALTVKSGKQVRKAVIPVAGFGTRLYPETRAVKKEFLPIIDKDSLMKPAIMVLLEELNNIGIEEICIIINRAEEAFYKQFFFGGISAEHLQKLPDNSRNYEKTIAEIAKKITFVYQDEQKGFGHAVWQSADFAGNEPVLLLLGDTIYESEGSVPCTKQLLNQFEKYGKSIVAVQSVPLDKVMHYGIFKGVWEDKEETVLNLTDIAEKPTEDVAREYLCVKSMKCAENYYGAFGCYVIGPEVYKRLKDAVRNNIVNTKGEVELTDALKYVMKNEGLMAFVPDGKSYDLGNPAAYRETFERFGKKGL